MARRPTSAYFGLVLAMNPRLTLASSVSELPKVKPLDQRRLKLLGIQTVRELLLHLPFEWERFGEPKPVAELRVGALATVIGTITQIAPIISKYKKLKLTQATLVDQAED